jgi:hypothetical protein
MITRISLIIFLFLFLSCTKEQEGGVQIRAKTRRGYTYSDFSAALSYVQYGDVLKRGSARDVNQTIVLSPIPDGKYYWSCIISYDSAHIISGNRSFGGDVIIEKGKLKDILIEVD